MILSFKTKWADGRPNYFVQLIANGMVMKFQPLIGGHFHKELMSRVTDYELIFGTISNDQSIIHPQYKYHTIRPDAKKLWKAGNKIHMYAGRYTAKNRVQFAPAMLCKAVQEIEILRYASEASPVSVCIVEDQGPQNPKLRRYLDQSQIQRLAQNDGFDSVEHFANYFTPKPGDMFEGRIIHWTDVRY